MSNLKWKKEGNDQGASYYTADSQALAAQYAFGKIVGDTFMAITPELQCRDTTCCSLVVSMAGNSTEDHEIYGATFDGDMDLDRLWISVKTNSLKSIRNKIGILHSLEKFYSSQRTVIHEVVADNGGKSRNRLILEAPDCWIKSVPMLSLYLLLIRAFNGTTTGYDSYTAFIKDEKVKEFTDGMKLVDLRDRIKLPALLTHCSDIFSSNPITGYDDDCLENDYFDEGEDNKYGYGLTNTMSYGIDRFSKDVVRIEDKNRHNPYTTTQGRDWLKKYEELRQNSLVKRVA